MEDYERTARKVLKSTAYVILVLHLLLIIEGFPMLNLLVGIVAHLAYFGLLSRFPKVSLTNVVFIISCGTDSFLSDFSCSDTH